MDKTWKPTVAGILVIIPGAVAVVVGATHIIPIVKEEISGSSGLGILLLPWALLALLVGIIAVVGGIYALRRKNWGLALAGSIFALPGWVVLGVLLPVGLTPVVAAGTVLGVLAIVFVIMGRREFEHGAMTMVGTGFCPACGAPTASQTEICANCGAKLAEAVRPRTWKPKVAGILTIIAGVPIVAIGILFVIAGGELGFFGFLLLPLAGFGLLGVFLGIIPIAGGISALRRRNWGLALAGSIVTVVIPLILVALAMLLLPAIPSEDLPVTTATEVLARAWYSVVGLVTPGVLAIIFVIKGKREFR